MRRDVVELVFTTAGQPCRRPGIDEGKLTLVSVNFDAGIVVVHEQSRTSWWGQQNHYCPAGFGVYAFDPLKVTRIGNEKTSVMVTVSPQCEFQSKRKGWGDPDAMRSFLLR